MRHNLSAAVHGRRRSILLVITLVLVAGGVAVAVPGLAFNPTLASGFDDTTETEFCILASDIVNDRIATESTRGLFPLGSVLPVGTQLHVENPTLLMVAELGSPSTPFGDGVWGSGGTFTIHNVSGADFDFSDVIYVVDLKSVGPPDTLVLQLVPLVDPTFDFDIRRIVTNRPPLTGLHDLTMGFVVENIDLLGPPSSDPISDAPLRAYKMAPLGILPAGQSVSFNLLFSYELQVTANPFSTFLMLKRFSWRAGFFRVDDIDFLPEDRVQECIDEVDDLLVIFPNTTPLGDKLEDVKNALTSILAKLTTDPKGAVGEMKSVESDLGAAWTLAQAANAPAAEGFVVAWGEQLARIARAVAMEEILVAKAAGKDVRSALDKVSAGDTHLNSALTLPAGTTKFCIFGNAIKDYEDALGKIPGC